MFFGGGGMAPISRDCSKASAKTTTHYARCHMIHGENLCRVTILEFCGYFWWLVSSHLNGWLWLFVPKFWKDSGELQKLLATPLHHRPPERTCDRFQRGTPPSLERTWDQKPGGGTPFSQKGSGTRGQGYPLPCK